MIERDESAKTLRGKTLLTDSGAREDNIRADETPGFTRGHHEAPHSERMGRRRLLLLTIVLMIIGAVSLHVVGAMFLFQGGFDARSLNNPLSYVLIGLFFVVAIFKLTYLLGHMHPHKQQAAGEISKGIRSTSDVQHERRREYLP